VNLQFPECPPFSAMVIAFTSSVEMKDPGEPLPPGSQQPFGSQSVVAGVLPVAALGFRVNAPDAR